MTDNGKTESEEYDLIIRFKSKRNFLEMRSEIINKRLEDSLFDDLQSWEFDRSKFSILSKLEKENSELKITCQKLNEIKNYLAYDIPHELTNEATNKIWRMI